MTFWLLYLAIDGDFTAESYPYHFSEKATCVKLGEEFVRKYKFEKYRCIKDERE